MSRFKNPNDITPPNEDYDHIKSCEQKYRLEEPSRQKSVSGRDITDDLIDTTRFRQENKLSVSRGVKPLSSDFQSPRKVYALPVPDAEPPITADDARKLVKEQSPVDRLENFRIGLGDVSTRYIGEVEPVSALEVEIPSYGLGPDTAATHIGQGRHFLFEGNSMFGVGEVKSALQALADTRPINPAE
jgi:hypothetical protein